MAGGRGRGGPAVLHPARSADGRRLALERTDQVGELDGAPAALRYLANHVRLARDREVLFAKVRSGGANDHDQARLDTLTRILEPARELGVDANGRATALERDRQFLWLRTEGEGGAVEVFGDLDTARNVAVLVPGMGNSLETLPARPPGPAPSVPRPARVPR